MKRWIIILSVSFIILIAYIQNEGWIYIYRDDSLTHTKEAVRRYATRNLQEDAHCEYYDIYKDSSFFPNAIVAVFRPRGIYSIKWVCKDEYDEISGIFDMWSDGQALISGTSKKSGKLPNQSF